MAAEPSQAETKPEESSGSGPEGRLVLLVTSTRGRVQIDVPPGGTVTIGRGSRVEVQSDAEASTCAIPDELLSRRHLRICGRLRGYVVEDLGSRNGSHLDGRPLGAKEQLRDGSILFFGSQVVVCRMVSDAARAALRQELETPFGAIATSSPSLALTLARLRRLARTEADLVLVGEAGVGKEVYARAVHETSGRRGQFRKVDCPSWSAEFVESDLEAADGGTLLLDELGAMPRDIQTTISRFLRDRTINPLRTRKPRRVDLRVIGAATCIGQSDLTAHLGGDVSRIPPLRERPEDVVPLLARFAGRRIEMIEPSALRAMCLYSWPLNVRELETATRNAIALSDNRWLRLEHLPATIRAALDRGPLITARRRSPRAAPDRAELEQLLHLHGGNVSKVARVLDRKWPVVWRWLVRLGLQPDAFRKAKKKSKR